LGGGVFLLAGGLLARETFAWAWEGVLDFLTAGMGDTVTWATFPWFNAIGIALMFLGLGILIGPKLRRLFSPKRPIASSDEVQALQESMAAFEAPLEHRMDVLEDRIEKLEGWREALPSILKLEQDLRTEVSNLLGGKIDDVEAGLRRAIDKVAASQSLASDYQRTQVASLYNALAAILHREQLRSLGAAIEAGAKMLSDPTDTGVSYSQKQWEEWQANESAWRSRLN
jgi:hypothetical protein